MNLTTGWSPIIFTIIQIGNLFIINILMLNFMVAILSTSYEEMLESGSFKYKCALFDYCERYMIAFSDEKLGEIVVHPPPINVSVILILPFLLLPEKPFNKWMPKISKIFSKCNYWIENVVGLICFIAFECVLWPFVFLITFRTVITTSSGNYKWINFIRWAILGNFYLFYIMCKDLFVLL